MSIREKIKYFVLRATELDSKGVKDVFECICIIESEIKQIESDMEGI